MQIPDQAVLVRTLETVERLGAAADGQEALAIASASLRGFGFTAFVYTRLPDPRLAGEPLILMDGWPEKWSERYEKAGHYAHDPLAAHCMTSRHPFTWDEIPASYWSSPLSRLVADEARAFDLNDGICVPLHDALGAGGLSLAGERYEAIPGIKHLAALLGQGIREASERALLARTGKQRLTVRERDILSWVAHGRTVAEIAATLGISEHTVSEHLKNIRHKLGSTNAAHSIVRALQLGQLRL